MATPPTLTYTIRVHAPATIVIFLLTVPTTFPVVVTPHFKEAQELYVQILGREGRWSPVPFLYSHRKFFLDSFRTPSSLRRGWGTGAITLDQGPQGFVSRVFKP